MPHEYALAVLLALTESARVDASVLPGVRTCAVHQSVFELTLVHVPVHVGILTLAVDLILGEIAFVYVPVLIDQPSVAVTAEIFQGTLVQIPVGVGDLRLFHIHLGANAGFIDQRAGERSAVFIHPTEILHVSVLVIVADVADAREINEGGRRDQHRQSDGGNNQKNGRGAAMLFVGSVHICPPLR